MTLTEDKHILFYSILFYSILLFYTYLHGAPLVVKTNQRRPTCDKPQEKESTCVRYIASCYITQNKNIILRQPCLRSVKYFICWQPVESRLYNQYQRVVRGNTGQCCQRAVSQGSHWYESTISGFTVKSEHSDTMPFSGDVGPKPG